MVNDRLPATRHFARAKTRNKQSPLGTEKTTDAGRPSIPQGHEGKGVAETPRSQEARQSQKKANAAAPSSDASVLQSGGDDTESGAPDIAPGAPASSSSGPAVPMVKAAPQQHRDRMSLLNTQYPRDKSPEPPPWKKEPTPKYFSEKTVGNPFRAGSLLASARTETYGRPNYGPKHLSDHAQGWNIFCRRSSRQNDEYQRHAYSPRMSQHPL